MTARLRLLYGLVLSGAILLSLKATFGLAGVDGDSMEALTLWQGVRAHGLSFLTGFVYTPDNWLLSIIPINFLSFFVFGATPGLVILSGWLVLVGTAFLAGMLAWLSGARRAAWLLPVMLLLVGAYAHQTGYADSPTSHDVTNLYGMAALCCVLRVIVSGGIGWSVLLALLLTLGTISDPWMVTSYDLPLLGFAILHVFVWPTRYRACDLRTLAAVSLAALILSGTHLFGILGFLSNQSARLAWPGMMLGNIVYLIKDMGGMFAALPVSRANAWGPALFSLAGCGLVACACSSGLRTPRNFVFAAFLVISALSAVMTCGGFVLLRSPQGDFSGRFLINIFYLCTIGAAAAADHTWRGFKVWQKSAVSGMAVLFVMSGIITTWPAWSAPGLMVRDNDVRGVITFLEANGLTYGYGPFHGIEANAITALSDGRVIVRPVIFNKRNGMMTPIVRAMTSHDWLTEADIPPGQARFFVMLGPNPEECLDVALCRSGLSTQFGPPSESYRYGADTILVWEHALLGYPYGVKGDYWGGEGWAWMGRTLTLTSRTPMQVKLRADPRNGPVTHLKITINGTRTSRDLLAGQTMTVSIPPAAVSEIAASPDFAASLALNKSSRKRYALMIDLPQPAP